MDAKLPEWVHRAQYINLTTFRRNGQAVATPVWFVALNDRLYVMTNVNSGKAKRIRANGKALVAPSDVRGRPLGEFWPARARPIDDAQLLQEVEAAFDRKYRWQRRIIRLVAGLRARSTGDPSYVIELELLPPSP
ncbi:PPOX class F420-dependent oxidoreductase [uncultured Thermanaerothrix sp.]|uniref:PPOX class F420-dependent oxidoreductase n=1 Tax=uncultured Thermanaerothrix sp. TaxID=1195149 RepID=UPI002621C66E|nr:PPOX class F420-dependent oxidoreductase [uncultured Thermanaerothrix sp.]